MGPYHPLGAPPVVASLSDALDEISQDAVDRLNKLGVFADEERKIPSLSMVRTSLSRFEDVLRSKGYAGGPLEIDEIEQPKEGVYLVVYNRHKFTNVHSAAAVWYGDYEDRWHKRVDERVRDWIKRLTELKATMERWLPSGMSITDRSPILMNEELMKKFNVSPAQMPTFEIRKGAQPIMRIQPKGLYIIGANGRVDLITSTASYILVDEAEPLSDNPDWRYYSPSNRQKSTQLDKSQFLRLLN